MAEFPMCAECAWEYTHPETRRYDAQPVCCNECGPEVYLFEPETGKILEKGSRAIRHVRLLIKKGGIVAVKGIGGFHLCCDAGNREAVLRLRQRKSRPRKPFAVMMRNLEAVRRECKVLPWQEEILTGHQKPVLLLEKGPDCSIDETVAPDNPKLGVMLPYAPVQLLLFDSRDEIEMPDCLVMTSANARGAPLCRDDRNVAEEIAGFCDAVLSHNRLIRIRDKYALFIVVLSFKHHTAETVVILQSLRLHFHRADEQQPFAVKLKKVGTLPHPAEFSVIFCKRFPE